MTPRDRRRAKDTARQDRRLHARLANQPWTLAPHVLENADAAAPAAPAPPAPSAPATTPPARDAGAGPGERERAERASLGTSTGYASRPGHEGCDPCASSIANRRRSQREDARGPVRWERYRRTRSKVDRTCPRSRQDGRDQSRDERYVLRRRARGLWQTDRVKACGKAGVTPDNTVTVKWVDARGTAAEATTGANGVMAGVAGLAICGNVWLCPVCAHKVAARRAARIERALRAAIEAGGWAVLVTFTLRHHQRHPLGVLVDALRAGWRAIRSSGGAPAKERTRYGIRGIVRSIEVTHGDNGWHPHVHALVVFRGRPDSAQVHALARSMFGRWSAAIVRAGLPAPIADQGGLDVSTLSGAADAGTYASLAQWSRYAVKGISGETVMGVVKDAKGTNRSIRQLMSDALIPSVWTASDGRTVQTLDDTARELLLEYERETKRLKHVTGTAELEKDLGLDPDERTDEQIAAEEVEGQGVAVVAAGYFDDLVEPQVEDLLAAGEALDEHGEPGGPDAMRRWLDRHGVPWTMPTRDRVTWDEVKQTAARDTADKRSA